MSGTKKRTARRKAKTATWERKRKKKIEIYLSDEEHEKFLAKCAAKSRTHSEQVRFWINIEPKRKSAPPPTAADPRQTSIDDVTARAEGEALRAWAEREGKTDWLQENIS